MAPNPDHHTSGSSVLSIGGTNFIGKVVLERILTTTKVDKVFLLVRPKRDVAPGDRVDQLQKLPCFRDIQESFGDGKVQAVAGDICQPSLGLAPGDRKMLTLTTTHIINLAASIEFDLPMEVAATSNTISGLSTLELAQDCVQLKSFVHCSTAYVNLPRKGGEAILEEHLTSFSNGQATKTFERIQQGVTAEEEKTMLQESGYPNTYCFTKALAETLLVERKASVPLVIVRPSIVTACYQHPFPGWIDSKATIAAFIAMYGAGYSHTVAVKEDAKADVVPCDFVAQRLIHAAFDSIDRTDAPVIHACIGIENCMLNGDWVASVEKFFKPKSRHVFQRPFWRVVAESTDPQMTKSFKKDKRRVRLLQTFAKLVRQKKMARTLGRVATGLEKLEVIFSFFLHNTFNFHAKETIKDVFPGFEANEWMDVVNMGIYVNLLGGKPERCHLKKMALDSNVESATRLSLTDETSGDETSV